MKRKIKINHPIIPYVMINHKMDDMIAYYVKKGCRVIEVGVPFSDPSADGPIIEQASLDALREGYSLYDVLEKISTYKEIYPKVHFIVMSYLNPIYHMGFESFFKTCKADGIIIPDLPVEEYKRLDPYLRDEGPFIIPLISPNTSAERLQFIMDHGPEMVYLMGVEGITGHKSSQLDPLLKIRNHLKDQWDVTCITGFGIRTSDQIRRYHKHFNGLVIGSHLIHLWEKKSYDAIDALFFIKDF
jgi:tryptophan synthase alpha chain